MVMEIVVFDRALDLERRLSSKRRCKSELQRPNVTGKSVQLAPNQALNSDARQLCCLVPSALPRSGAG